MSHAFSTENAPRPRVVVHDAADINRLIIHLFSHWTMPLIEIRIDALVPVVVQWAQHHIARIVESRHGALGGGLAAVMFVVGVIMAWASPASLIWTSWQMWQYLGLVALATLYAGLIGLGIEHLWTRLKLMLLLRRLRRLAAGVTVEELARYAGRISPEPASRIAGAAGIDAMPDDHVKQRPFRLRRKRSRVNLHSSRDIRMLTVHLFTHWKLPHVVISVDGIPTVDVQRAQHRIANLSDACNCVLGAWLAAAATLGGAFSAQWTLSHNWSWRQPDSWGSLELVPVAALFAAFIGWAIEVGWSRLQLVRVVRSVRHRLRD